MLGVPPDIERQAADRRTQCRPWRRASDAARSCTLRAEALRAGCARASRGALRADSRAGAARATASSPGRARATDGRRYVAAALAAGAAACLVEAEGVEAFGFDGDERIAALRRPEGGDRPDRRALPTSSPSARLDVLAVTGTNGKTSTAWWTAQALTRARPALRRDRHAGHRRAARDVELHRPDHARPGDCCSARCAASSTRGFARLRDRGLVDRHRRAPARRHAHRGGAVHQLHAGPPRLPRHHGGLLGRPRRELFALAGPARRGGQHRRRAGRGAGARSCTAARSTCGPTRCARDGAAAGAATSATTTAACASTLHEGGERHALRDRA